MMDASRSIRASSVIELTLDRELLAIICVPQLRSCLAVTTFRDNLVFPGLH